MTEEPKPKVRISKKERKARAERKRLEIAYKIRAHMEQTIPGHTVFAYVKEKAEFDFPNWIMDGNRFVTMIIRQNPQDGELIRSAALRFARQLQKELNELTGIYKKIIVHAATFQIQEVEKKRKAGKKQD